MRVHTQDGVEEIEAAGLIGADGVRSSVRGHLVPSERDAPAYSGCVAWRATLPAESVPAALRAREFQSLAAARRPCRALSAARRVNDQRRRYYRRAAGSRGRRVKPVA